MQFLKFIGVFSVVLLIAGSTLYYVLSEGPAAVVEFNPKRDAMLVLEKGKIVYLDTSRIDSIIFLLYGRIYDRDQKIVELQRQLQLLSYKE